MCIIEKSKTTQSEKNFKVIFYGTVEKTKNCSWHNSMPEKGSTQFKYENARYISWNNWLKIL